MHKTIPRHWCEICGESVRFAIYQEHVRTHHPNVANLTRSAYKRLALLTTPVFAGVAMVITYGIVQGEPWGRVLAFVGIIAYAVYTFGAYRVSMRPVTAALHERPVSCPVCGAKTPRDRFQAHVSEAHTNEESLFSLPGKLVLGTAAYALAVGLFIVAIRLFGLLTPYNQWRLTAFAIATIVIAIGVMAYVVLQYVPRRVAKAREAYRSDSVGSASSGNRGMH